MPSRPIPAATPRPEARWMLLIHQIPPKPAYLRVKIGRHLQRLGAVAIKNSVYALPAGDEAQEDLQWVRGEVDKGGGEASIVEARFVDGLDDREVVELFQAAREADYRALLGQAREVAGAFPRVGLPPEGRRTEAAAQVRRLRRRLGEIVAIDFFGASGREAVEGLVAGLEQRMKPETDASTPRRDVLPNGAHQGRTWVTRTGIKVDRMASAWLIRRFIDPKARFKFVPAKDYRPAPRELRFDMFEAEFTHEGDRCTFEVLVERFGLGGDARLRAVAEIVHDIDLKDGKFGREEAAGVGQLVSGIAAAHPDDDEARLARGTALFEDLYAAQGEPTRH
ncbi:MAG TPA: chromate resistance protein ChrB domain-containing protein [Anaeromyxobacteraceae bacterium]|nr:chromate resistance protein ChrB domain-containing protein [Anaeromyxobacteraceae bacterium]